MTKFEDANDDGFLKVSGELRRYIEVAKQAGSITRLNIDSQARIACKYFRSRGNSSTIN
jgi:hypothetical protein